VARSASSMELRRAGVLASSSSSVVDGATAGGSVDVLSSSEEDCGSPSDTYMLMAMSLRKQINESGGASHDESW